MSEYYGYTEISVPCEILQDPVWDFQKGCRNLDNLVNKFGTKKAFPHIKLLWRQAYTSTRVQILWNAAWVFILQLRTIQYIYSTLIHWLLHLVSATMSKMATATAAAAGIYKKRLEWDQVLCILLALLLCAFEYPQPPTTQETIVCHLSSQAVLVLFLVSHIKFTTYWFSFHFAVVAFVCWSFDTIKPFDNPVKTTFEWKSVVWQIFFAPLHSPQMTFGF